MGKKALLIGDFAAFRAGDGLVGLYHEVWKMAKLGHDFFNQDTVAAARALLGRYLVRRWQGETLAVRITETEAYRGPVDKACHAYGGCRTARTEPLFAPPGTSYVYLIYGMYHCLNLVTEPEGVPCAVLLRGGAVRAGADTVSRLRFGAPFGDLNPARRKNLLNGPGKLCQGLSVTREQNRMDLTESDELYVTASLAELGLPEEPPVLPGEIHTGKRVGIDYAEEAAEFPWRFWIDCEHGSFGGSGFSGTPGREK